jgi:hypothetical protein
MTDTNEGVVGGGSPPLGPPLGPSLEAEEKALKKGKGPMMAIMIIVPLLIVGTFVGYILLTGEGEQYKTLRRNVNAYRTEYFDGFWACALDGTPLSGLQSNEDVIREINRRAGSQQRPRWTAHVRDDCMPKLEELEPKLQALIAPAEMAEHLNAVIAATAAHRTTFSGYLGYLDGLAADAPYDSEDASEHTLAISRAWFDYRKAQIEINDAIREKLGE